MKLLSSLLGFFLPLFHTNSTMSVAMMIAVSTIANSTTAAVTTVMYSLRLSSSSAVVEQVEVVVGVV